MMISFFGVNNIYLNLECDYGFVSLPTEIANTKHLLVIWI